MSQFKVYLVVTVDAATSKEAETTVTTFLEDFVHTEVTHTREVLTAKVRPVSNISPMSFDLFSIKYMNERAKAGDPTNPDDLTAAYAVYCRDPAGHWLHKEK